MSEKYNIIPLIERYKYKVEQIYVRVFAGPPWFEIKKCKLCEEGYGADEDLEIFRNGMLCRRCRQPLELIDYWGCGAALQKIEEAIENPSFIGFIAEKDRAVSGFTWGYTLLSDKHTDKEERADKLRAKGIDYEETFHLSEIAVDPNYQKLGIGTGLAKTVFTNIKVKGYKGLHFSTKNQNLLKICANLFGEHNVNYLFQHPNAQDVGVYYCEIKYLEKD